MDGCCPSIITHLLWDFDLLLSPSSLACLYFQDRCESPKYIIEICNIYHCSIEEAACETAVFDHTKPYYL